MSVILRNDYGAIAVNKGVIESMIVEDLLSMGDDIILCSRKGKPVGKNPGRFMDPDYFDAVDIYEKKDIVRVRVFIITRLGGSISDIAEKIFTMIENDYAMLRLSKPKKITVSVKGVMSDQLIKRSIEVVRKNA